MTTKFVWKGKTAKGEVITGEYKAEDRRDVAEYLRKRRVIIQSVRKKPVKSKMAFGGKKGVGVKDLAVFTRQFATMVNAGLPLVQCLDILGQQQPNEILQEGHPAGDAGRRGRLRPWPRRCAKHPKIFDDLYVNMVAAGEAGGILDIILQRLAVFLEKNDALQRKVKGALTYPAIVLFVATGACIFMLIGVIPVFAKMFSDFGGELPAPTRIVMGSCRTSCGATGGPARRHGGHRVRFKRLPGHREGRAAHRQAAAEDAGPRQRAAQGRGGAVHPHAGHADRFRCARSCRASRSPRKTAGNRVIQDAIEATAAPSARVTPSPNP